MSSIEVYIYTIHISLRYKNNSNETALWREHAPTTSNSKARLDYRETTEKDQLARPLSRHAREFASRSRDTDRCSVLR